jgi:threonine dehydratase
MRPALAEIQQAQEILKGHFAPTRLLAAESLGDSKACQAYLKLESELPTGSFKVRGALVALERALKSGKIREVIASSTGNHGAAVAYAAQRFGLKARIYLPSHPNPVKRQKIAALGAEIVESGGPDLASAFIKASEYANRPGVYFLNDATDQALPAGPATIASEILERLPSVSAIFVPVGDTALIRGVASATRLLARGVKIIGVQSERAPSYFLSWKQGRAISTDDCDTIADGLATRTPEQANVLEIRELVDDMVLVSEDQLLGAIALLLLDEHIVAEPAGAAATAAFLSYRGLRGDAALLVTGQNIPREILLRAVSRAPGA